MANSSEAHILMFLLNGHLLIVIYLLTATTLPDSIPEEGLDLKEYYFGNSRYFWGFCLSS